MSLNAILLKCTILCRLDMFHSAEWLGVSAFCVLVTLVYVGSVYYSRFVDTLQDYDSGGHGEVKLVLYSLV